MFLANFFLIKSTYQSREALNKNRQKITYTLQNTFSQAYSSHDKFKEELYSLKERSKPKETIQDQETDKLLKTRKIRLLSECLGFM